MRNEKDLNVDVHTRALRAADRTINGNGKMPTILHGDDPPFPFLEVLVKQAKDSPFLVVGIMISIAAIIVAAVMSLTVGFGIFLFTMNGTMHEIKAQQSTILVQQAKLQSDVDSTGTAMRAYEAANGKRIEFMVGLMTQSQQRAVNAYTMANPLPSVPKQRDN